MNKLLTQYFELQKQIYDYFGYVEQWRVFPLGDCREFFWSIEDDEVIYVDADNVDTALKKIEDEEHYGGNIYTQRHLDKHVFRGEKYTMALVDTGVDLNILLMIFDNDKEVKDE